MVFVIIKNRDSINIFFISFSLCLSIMSFRRILLAPIMQVQFASKIFAQDNMEGLLWK
jgi:hypothetical protein